MQLHLNKQWYHGSIWSWFQAGFIEIYRCTQQSLSSKKDFFNICLKSSQTSIKAHQTWRLTFDSTTVASKLFNYWQDMGCSLFISNLNVLFAHFYSSYQERTQCPKNINSLLEMLSCHSKPQLANQAVHQFRPEIHNLSFSRSVQQMEELVPIYKTSWQLSCWAVCAIYVSWTCQKCCSLQASLQPTTSFHAFSDLLSVTFTMINACFVECLAAELSTSGFPCMHVEGNPTEN